MEKKSTISTSSVRIVLLNDDLSTFYGHESIELANNIHVQQLLDSLNQALKMNTVLKVTQHIDKLC